MVTKLSTPYGLMVKYLNLTICYSIDWRESIAWTK